MLTTIQKDCRSWSNEESSSNCVDHAVHVNNFGHRYKDTLWF